MESRRPQCERPVCCAAADVHGSKNMIVVLESFPATSHQGAGPTHPHAEGRQAPPCPVTQVEEKETGDWDEVHICKKYSVILISSVSEGRRFQLGGRLTPGASVCDGGLGVGSDGGKHTDADGKVETDGQSQQPDLQVKGHRTSDDVQTTQTSTIDYR